MKKSLKSIQTIQIKMIKSIHYKSLLDRILLIKKRDFATEIFPYTSELYKKNYIKYKVQSKQMITHDTIFYGDERLPSFDDRIKELTNSNDDFCKNIGHLIEHRNIKELQKWYDQKIKEKENKQFELSCRELKLTIPLDVIDKNQKIMNSFEEIKNIADYYNINKDLFKNYYFQPVLDLQIEYTKTNDSSKKSVFFGNRIPAQDVTSKPNQIRIEDILESNITENAYHSLLFLNMDGNFQDNENEVLLWFMSNIKKLDVNNGDEVIEYIQPFPMRGTGWHRCVYLLFQHTKPIDFTVQYFKNNNSKFGLRNFNTSKFFSTYQNDIKPVSLRFFQTEWDASVKGIFHNYLDIKEPSFEYEFENKFIPKYEKYPKNQPFNWYMQDYTDKKKISENIFQQYLKDLSPFESYPNPSKYPLQDVSAMKPKWYKYELENLRKRKQKYSSIPFKYPAKDLNKLNKIISGLPYQQK